MADFVVHYGSLDFCGTNDFISRIGEANFGKKNHEIFMIKKDEMKL